MNIFNHYKQKENHYSNILMTLLSLDNSRLLKQFSQKFLPQADKLNFGEPQYVLFSESAGVTPRDFEYLLAIAPFPRKKNELRNNSDSIPDAWVVGENVTILFEFKVTGTIDEAQFSAHRRKLSTSCQEIEVSWKEIARFLEEAEVDSTLAFLIEQFAAIIMDLKSPRPSSGMPKYRTSGRKARHDEPYFVITKNANIEKNYQIHIVLPGKQQESLSEDQTGIMDARRWIVRYIKQADDPSVYLTLDNEFIDKCIKPERIDPSWNRWEFGKLVAREK
ncbi:MULTISPECIES: hypothetical protein [unclassified Paenibacillus]|uniref:hypothetical protein n=1 Tax=unclassified Paenibacillus TaxID=185978 RepID=UPI00277DE2FC|nr:MULTISPECIES: hypothetical protein [unclassified Paenibacillus]MDQ0896358.1 hypothetical protein [Paenibacillus sp. V4I7]MDQ0914099.1 hypothetical protein [Paenibacillus sp. V4I5]